MAINVTIWNEFRHEKTDEGVKALYPNGLHAYIKSFLDGEADFNVKLCSLDEPGQELTDEILNSTDVLLWWGHLCHNDVPDELVSKIRARVLSGMGFMPLHSAHKSKPFMSIIGTTGNLTWGRNQKGIIWNLCPTHPITAGIPSHFFVEEELYAEPFYIPKPDDLIFGTWYEDGNIFRGGVTFTRGLGKIFYFHVGHETCESFKNEYVQRIIKNAIRWCKPVAAEPGFELNDCIHQLDECAPYKKA